MLDPIFKLTRQHEEDARRREKLNQYTNEIVQARKQHCHSGPKQLEPDVDEVYTKPQIFIDQLLSNGRLPDDDIIVECNTMLVAGSETTALTIANACLLLAMFPDTQDKLMKEIDEFWAKHTDSKFDAESLSQLTYLEMVLKETLRLAPTIPIIARTPLSDFDLGPAIVKPGVIVTINIFSVHRSTKYWGDDAETFRPERFAPENFDKINPNAFIPFSSSVRNCIGECEK
jgi:cytochrome P450